MSTCASPWLKKKKAPAWPEQKNFLLVNMCVHEADSIKMSAIGEWQCADDWWLTNAKSRPRFCSMMSNIDSVSVGSYANARALQRDLRLKLQAKITPNNKKKKCFPSPGKKSFWKILKGAAPGRGVRFEQAPTGRRARRTLLQLWWELGAKSFSSAATFCLGLCFVFAAAGPVQGSNALVPLSTEFIFRQKQQAVLHSEMPSTPALLHAPLPTPYIQAKLLGVCKLLPRAKLVAEPDKLASAGKWWISEHSDGTKESGIPPCSLSQAPWLSLWVKPTFSGRYWGIVLDCLNASGSEEYPQREVKLYWQAL